MSIRSLGVALVAASGLVLGPAGPAGAQEQARTITVSGSAASVVPNDLARFTFGVQTRRPTADAALRATSARVRRVIARVRGANVAADDVMTSTISVFRSTRPAAPRSTRRIVEYVSTNSIGVTVRDVGRSGEVIDAAIAGGATGLSGPVFSSSDAEAVYRRTLVTAFQGAREKAQRLAAEAGVTLGAPVSIRETGAPPAPTPPLPSLSLPAGGFERRRMPFTPVRPGTSRVRAGVAVVFAIS
ncbi:MAG TPA: SIMPL domain-containing protein [Solirubrobacteraceae bacterium]|nr:SIMPL domain-containing protein [Solirubrobacteraceae bacterium]